MFARDACEKKSFRIAPHMETSKRQQREGKMRPRFDTDGYAAIDISRSPDRQSKPNQPGCALSSLHSLSESYGSAVPLSNNHVNSLAACAQAVSSYFWPVAKEITSRIQVQKRAKRKTEITKNGYTRGRIVTIIGYSNGHRHTHRSYTSGGYFFCVYQHIIC